MFEFANTINSKITTWQRSREISYLQKHATTLGLNVTIKDDQNFESAKLYIEAHIYGVLHKNENVIYDKANGSVHTYTQANEDSSPTFLEGEKNVIENSVKYQKLNFIAKAIFTFGQWLHAYKKKPEHASFIAGLTIAVLIYLQSGILSFTPVSTVILSTIFFLTCLLIYGATALLEFTDQAENPKNIVTKISEFAKAVYNDNHFKAKLVTYLGGILSLLNFAWATVNGILYSLFLTKTATSTMLLPVPLWGSFAIAVILLVCFYAYFRPGNDNQTESATNSTTDSFKLFGITADYKDFSTLWFGTAANVAVGASQVAKEAVRIASVDYDNSKLVGNAATFVSTVAPISSSSPHFIQ